MIERNHGTMGKNTVCSQSLILFSEFKKEIKIKITTTLYYENALSFTCGCGYQQEQFVSDCEVAEGGMSENGGKVATGGIDGMWLITQVMN